MERQICRRAAEQSPKMNDSSAALEQFLILAKSAKGRAAVALIQQAISSPVLYHFGEILDHENISALEQSPEFKPYLELLRIFAYGTLSEYRANPGLPAIDEAQALKLKQLSIISLAAENKVIPYSALLRELELSDTRTLEDLIIEGMYAGLFKGKLDQKREEFQVHDTAGRDCKPGQLGDMIATLQAWLEASEKIGADLTDNISFAEKAQNEEAARIRDVSTKIEEAKKTLQTAQGDSMDGAPGAGLVESMEMDDVSRPKSRIKIKHPHTSGGYGAGRH